MSYLTHHNKAGPNYGRLNQMHERFGNDGDVMTAAQPSKCPMEYINVTKTSNGKYQVDAKGRNVRSPEKTKHFQNKEEYDDFWKFMGDNLAGFSSCVNPVPVQPITSASCQAPKPLLSSEEAPASYQALPSEEAPTSCPAPAPAPLPSSEEAQARCQAPVSLPSSEEAQARCQAPVFLPSSEEAPPSEEVPKIDDQYVNKLLQPAASKTSDSYLNNLFDTTSTGQVTAILTIEYISRMIILFVLIYIFTGIIPKQPLTEQTKLIISAAVVVIYILFDLIKRLLVKVKGYVCTWACGC